MPDFLIEPKIDLRRECLSLLGVSKSNSRSVNGVRGASCTRGVAKGVEDMSILGVAIGVRGVAGGVAYGGVFAPSKIVKLARDILYKKVAILKYLFASQVDASSDHQSVARWLLLGYPSFRCSLCPLAWQQLWPSPS